MEIGTQIPDLLGRDQDGREVRLSDFPGRKVALYFYPKDNTPGCTQEACNLRDNYASLLDAGYAVVGVSADSERSHQRFREKHQLPFPLIADTDHALAERFGTWALKKMAGREYMGMLRTTFVISPDGRVERIITPKEIKVKDHAAQILS